MTGITCVETVSVSPSLPLNTNPPPPLWLLDKEIKEESGAHILHMGINAHIV